MKKTLDRSDKKARILKIKDDQDEVIPLSEIIKCNEINVEILAFYAGKLGVTK